MALPILLDCDPGHDDAIAIVLALASPELDVKAITSSAGNQTPEKTLRNVLRMLTLLNRTDIPVAGGAVKPLMRELIIADNVHGESGLDGPALPEPAFAPQNCTAVELFLNEKTRGIREVEPFGHAEWTVPYMPGTLKAIGYRDGKALCTDSRETTGRAVRLHLSCDNPEDLTGNGQNVVFFTCTCLDAAGREVPDATAEVRFVVNHCGKIVATGSDISDHAPLNALARRMRAGRITVAVQMAKAEAGETLRLYAESDTLESGSRAVQLS